MRLILKVLHHGWQRYMCGAGKQGQWVPVIFAYLAMSKHVRYRPYMAIKIQNLHQMTLLVAGCLPGTWLCHTCGFRFDCSWEPQRQSVTVLSISVAQYVSNAQLRG